MNSQIINPLVSIGLPVRNGANYLRAALDSILAQTFQDFELVISDNSSTDRTDQICLAYAERDRRIRYFRTDQNIGASANFNRVFQLSTGQYFKWAAHDDYLAPEFLSECVDILDAHPSVVLSFSKALEIDSDGNPTGTYDYSMAIDHSMPNVRFHDLILVRHNCIAIFGLIRSAALRKTPLIGGFKSSDRSLLARLSLMGKFYEIPRYLFSRREHAETSCNSFSCRQDLIAWYNPRKKGKISFPEWRLFFELSRGISQSALSPHERFHCYKHLFARMHSRWRYLLMDLLITGKDLSCRSALGASLLGYVRLGLNRCGFSFWDLIKN